MHKYFNAILTLKIFLCCLMFSLSGISLHAQAQTENTKFRVIAFYTAKQDQAHISFVHEANKWFAAAGTQFHFAYDSTNNWENLNSEFLSKYEVIVFLDTRPESATQRDALRAYMEKGGAWMGFHFAGFALTPSAYPQNWDWYHNQFIGAGEYKGNTWRPTSAILRVEKNDHPATKNLSPKITSAPSEWYSWTVDLKNNPDIEILLSIDPSSFPLGTGPKPHEIWHEGYYPVVWRNKKYNMLYLNMGHNDIDYEHKTNKQLSSTFSSEMQNKLIIDGLMWLGSVSK
jgi:hypothetical protein